MSFREKSVWVSFLVMLTLFGVWVWNLVRSLAGQAVRADVVRLSIGLLLFAVVVEIVLHIVLRVWSPRVIRSFFRIAPLKLVVDCASRRRSTIDGVTSTKLSRNMKLV